MDKLTDEIINAWLDGEATRQEGERIEAAICASPELGMRVARLSRANRLLGPAFAETMSGPIPQRFEAILRQPRRFAPLGSLKAALSALLTPAPIMAAAASLALGVVLGGALLAGSTMAPGITPDGDGRMIATAPMATQLASVASGVSEGSLRVRLSLIDEGGRYCRQFETAGASGLACLDAGEWVIDTLASGASAPDGAYVMANGAADPAVVAAIERRGVRQVLDSEEEARAIANGWRAPAN